MERSRTVDEVRPQALLGSSLVLGALLAVRVGLLAIALLSAPGAGSSIDAARFEQVASQTGRAWRDVQIEFPPIELVTIELIGGDGPNATRDRLALLSFAGDLATVAALWWGWGRRPAVLYLLLGAPLLPILYWRIDPPFVALTVWAVAAGRRSGVVGALGLAVSTLARAWPAVVVPAIGRATVRRAASTYAAGMMIGLAGWLAFAGWDGPRQVVTARGAQGWSADGVVGSLWWIAGGTVRTEQGSLRVGTLGPAVQLALALVLALTLIWIWSRGLRCEEPAGLAAATAVAALLTVSPLSSVQYVTWVLPWVAIGAREPRGRSVAVLASIASAAAGAFAFAHPAAQADATWPLQLTFLVKNVAIFGVLVVGVVELAKTSEGRDPAAVRARRGRARRPATPRGSVS